MTVIRIRHVLTNNPLAIATVGEAIKDYLDYTNDGGHTARAKVCDLEYLRRIICRRHKTLNPYLSEVTQADIKATLAAKEAEGRKPSTICRLYDISHHFWEHECRVYPGLLSPMQGVKRPHVEPRKPQALNDEELTEARSFDLCCSMGLRRDEVSRLDITNVSADLSRVVNAWGKGGRRWSAPIHPAVAESMRNYLGYRSGLLRERGLVRTLSPAVGPLLLSVWGAKKDQPESWRLSPESIYRIMQTVGLRPHQGRHSFATWFYRKSNDIRLTAKALRHTDLRHTMTYTEQTEDRIREVYESK